MTAPSILFIATRWIMLATGALQFASATEATFDSILLLCTSDIDIFPSNCETLEWATQALYFSGFIGTAREQANSPLHPFFVFSMVPSIFRHTSICNMATKL